MTNLFRVEANNYIKKYIHLNTENDIFVCAKEYFTIEESISDNKSRNFISTILINNIRYINKYFEKINNLIDDGYFVGVIETNQTRNNRILEKNNVLIAYFKIVFNFFFLRVFPKLKITKKLYFFITKGKGRALSKAEILGRLISCGFEIIDYKEIEGLLYFITKKVREPYYDMNPSYSPLFKMKRIGQNGKIIYVYKFRTMHSYSEYLQEYLVKAHGYNDKGKIINDFRRTKYGRFLRKYWLDELPQLINVFKGEMKLFGVRPLSQTRFNEFPDDVKRKRIKYKPGCFPPYVALLMPDKTANIEAERIYLNEIENSKSPLLIDIKYILRSIFNIITGKIRSA